MEKDAITGRLEMMTARLCAAKPTRRISAHSGDLTVSAPCVGPDGSRLVECLLRERGHDPTIRARDCARVVTATGPRLDEGARSTSAHSVVAPANSCSHREWSRLGPGRQPSG